MSVECIRRPAGRGVQWPLGAGAICIRVSPFCRMQCLAFAPPVPLAGYTPFLWLIFLTALALKAAGSDVIFSATLVELDAAILVGCLIGATLQDSHTTIFDVYVALHGPHLEPNCRNHSSSSSSRVLLIPQCIICSSKKLEAAFKQQLLC